MAQAVLNPYTLPLSQRDPKCEEAARRYAKDRTAILAFVLPAFMTLLVILGLPPVAVALRDYTISFSDDPGVAVAIYVLLLTALVLLILLPASYSLGYSLPRKYGLLNLSSSTWWGRYSASVGRIVIWVVAVGEALCWIIRTMPDYWWVIAAVLWSAAVLLGNYGWSTNKFGGRKLEPLSEPELVSRLSQLVQRIGASSLSAWVMPTDKKRQQIANAWFMGLGRTRRIVITESMLENLSYDEIETLMAHELAHLKNGDIPKVLVIRIAAGFGTALIAYMLSIGLTASGTLDGSADLAMLPYLFACCCIGWVFGSMLNSARRRGAEREADRFAVELTGKSKAFKSALIKFADLNLVETSPRGRAEGSHPAIGERIAMAEAATGETAVGLHRRHTAVRVTPRPSQGNCASQDANADFSEPDSALPGPTRHHRYSVRRIRIDGANEHLYR